jgi:hypothetical protein
MPPGILSIPFVVSKNSMVFNRLVALAVLAGSALFPQTEPPKSDAQTQWQAIDQLCGQLELAARKKEQIIVDGKSELHLHAAYLDEFCRRGQQRQCGEAHAGMPNYNSGPAVQ